MPSIVMRDPQHIARTLRRAWLAQGIRQVDIARRSGIARPHVSRALSGKDGVSIENLFALTDALGYDLALIPREDT